MTVGLVDTVPALEEKLAALRTAQAKFATYTQEQVDCIFRAAALAANQARIPLAKMAVAETGMGVVEDKVIYNNYAAEYIYNAYKDTKTCGVVEEDKAFGTKRIAEPIGVIAAVIPTTNPTSTAIFKTLISLKTRNAVLISPHPRAKKSTIAAAKIVLDAAVAAGAPKDIIGWIDVPSLELTNTLMQEADLILATGGPGMVRAAYSSGKPALGVGAGNTPAVIDKTADILLAVNSIVHSKTFDNGMICASEQSVIVDDSIYDQVKAEFIKTGCYVLTPEETEKVRKTILINGALNSKIVGQPAAKIAELAGVTVDPRTKVLIGEVESVDLEEEFAHEKLSPVLAMYHAADFADALNKADQLVQDGGYGHTASLYIDTVHERERLDQFAARMKACRIVVNTPSSHGGIGDLYNFNLAPSLTLGCGSWGGNSVSENVGVKHLLNIKTVAERRENMLWFRAPEKVYLKKGCLPVALDELKTVMGKKKAFIVTDSFLYKNGFTKCITDKLDSVGNTTAAVGKGFALGSAALPSLALFASFAESTNITSGGMSILDAKVVVGLFLGGMLPFLFSAFTMSSVGKAANKMIEEVRRQFRDKPGILKGTEKPDYTKCVSISTTAALKEMLLPGIMAVVAPLLVGFLLGVESLGGLLAGALVSGVMMAIFMANSGGAWDNAKKFVEEGNFGGKGSEVHRATVVGDTVGDPFKDTSGPSLNILIKLMSMVAIVMAGLTVSWSLF